MVILLTFACGLLLPRVAGCFLPHTFATRATTVPHGCVLRFTRVHSDAYTWVQHIYLPKGLWFRCHHLLLFHADAVAGLTLPVCPDLTFTTYPLTFSPVLLGVAPERYHFRRCHRA